MRFGDFFSQCCGTVHAQYGLICFGGGTFRMNGRSPKSMIWQKGTGVFCLLLYWLVGSRSVKGLNWSPLNPNFFVFFFSPADSFDSSFLFIFRIIAVIIAFVRFKTFLDLSNYAGNGVAKGQLLVSVVQTSSPGEHFVCRPWIHECRNRRAQCFRSRCSFVACPQSWDYPHPESCSRCSPAHLPLCRNRRKNSRKEKHMCTAQNSWQWQDSTGNAVRRCGETEQINERNNPPPPHGFHITKGAIAKERALFPSLPTLMEKTQSRF